MTSRLRRAIRVLHDEDGQVMLEYIIIVAIVVLAGLAVFRIIQNYINIQRESISRGLNR